MSYSKYDFYVISIQIENRLSLNNHVTKYFVDCILIF